MRRNSRILIASGICLVLLLAAIVWRGAGRLPFGRRVALQNVVVIVIDTLRQDHLECYGYDRQTAPNICRMAAEGAIFDGISTSSWTMPATASILTGLHPIRHQAIERNDRLPGRATTLAETLKEHGYTTLAISGNGWVSEHFGFGQGFDEFIQARDLENQGHATAEQINALLFPRLEELHAPFFLYVHYMDPHSPYDPPYDWTQAPLDERLSARAPVNGADLRAKAFTRRDPQLMRDAVDLYDGEIRSVDSQIGELRARLQQLGLTAQTLTIIASDHGEEFEEHGRAGHGLNLYREVVQVPWIIHAPEVLPPALRLGRASLMDIVPTVLDFLGHGRELQDGARFDGSSLLSRLQKDWNEGEDPGSKDSASVPAPSGYLLHLDLDGAASLALIDQDDKIVLANNPYRKELFEVDSDPQEQRSLMRREAMVDRFTLLAQQLSESYNDLSLRALERETVDDAGDETRALEALGYITPSPQSLKPRLMPPRVVPADSRRGGLLGWEMPSDFAECIRISEEPANHQLLEGWGRTDPNGRGRWARRNATLVLRPPADVGPGDLELQIDGSNILDREVRLTVFINDEVLVRDRALAGGEWSLHLPVALAHRGVPLAVVRVIIGSGRSATTSPGEESTRRGVLVLSACLVASGGGA